MKKVQIWRENFTDTIKIMFVDHSGGFRSIYNPYTGKSYRTSENVTMDIELEKDFVMNLPGIEAQEFLQAMAEALDEKQIKTDKDAKIQGTLEATKYHLEDLRKLVFKIN